MKVQIRKGIFETNSSSVHTITICKDEEYNEWQNGNLKFCPDTESFLDSESADIKNNEIINKEFSDQYENFSDIHGYDLGYFYLSYYEYFDKFAEYYESFADSKYGVTAFGYYGYN